MLKRTFSYLLLILAFSSIAQTKKRNFRQREIGLFGGASYYIGDLNPRGHFFMSKPAVGAFFRYSTHYRYAFRFGFNYGTVMGNDAKSKELDQLERNLNFRSRIYDLHAIAEFNFVDYRIGNDKHRFTMFIFAGIGGFLFDPQSDIGQGYQSLDNTHGGVPTIRYSKFQINIPYGIGLKWHLTDIFGLGVEWSPRKLFTDYLDDVAGEYADGSMRGNPRTKDWYFFYGATLTMRLPAPHRPCFQNN
ncbi:DUF6089 family protein [Sediminibacterium sp.]|uniref:type IX secretion system protein PorG n=1 Tax=Sediminibacterium sp. TaxID=1917865 RepID=UPI00272325CF|nr:DUF6089 family protein [Sediminibacterium sp.]MDO9000542.1 DUF6089 family protein [Bacteroidota bacterium]MDP3146890.1 DUF6089 family protein [Bacteroidota bacterium]MDP3567571.1 DUF6089 family protein [Sediminibacterium sp.]